MTISKRTLYLLSVLVLVLLSLGASTAINLSDTNRTSGLLPVSRGGIGVATTAAGTVFGRAYLAGTGAPSFITNLQTGSIPFPTTARWLIWQATGSATTVYGDANAVVTCNVASNVAASSTLPSYWQCATSTTNGNAAILSGDLSEVVGRSMRYQSYRAMSATVTRRDWWGFTDQTGATMGAADDPAGNYAAFSYSTSRGGADFDCVTKDNTTQNVQTSGVNVDANFHFFEIVETPATNFLFYIDGTLVCTNSANLPTSGTPLRTTNTATCLTCTPTAVNLKNAWHYAQTSF